MRSERRVLIVTATLLFGGVERLVVNTAKELLKRGNYRPFVCNLSGRGDLLDELERCGVECYSLRRDNLRKDVIGNLHSIRRIVKTCQPDIIHTHQFASDFYGILGTLGLNIPVVSHIHNPQMERLSRRAMRYFLSRWFTSAFVAVTEEKAKALIQQVPVVRDRVFVLHNAIDPQTLRLPEGYSRTYYRNALGVPEDGLILGAVGRLCWEKGYDLLLQAFRLVLEKIPCSYLVLVGDGPEKGTLRNLSEELSVAGHTIFTGYRTDIAAIMSTFDVFVISSYTEAFPMVALEAMYVGIPLIMTNTVSAKDVLSPAALIVSPSVKSLAEGILSVLTDQEAKMELAAKGKSLVESQFTMDAYAAKLEAVYDMVLSGRL